MKSKTKLTIVCLFAFFLTAPLIANEPLYDEDVADIPTDFQEETNLEATVSEDTSLELTGSASEPILGPIADVVGSISTAALKYKYRDGNHDEPASVTFSTALSPEEKKFLERRKKRTEQAFKSLGISGAVKPVVAFCMSGGGYRAMLSATGFAQALADMGIFDVATYNAGLSGSSWHLSKLMHMALQRRKEKSLVDFKALVKDLTTRAQQIVLPNYKSLSNMAHLLSPLVGKYVYGQIITPTDFYGVLLGATLLDLGTSKYEKVRFSDFRKVTNTGEMALPIGTAVSKIGAHWFEFTPYHAGSAELGGFIPMYGLGRFYSRGKSTESAPEVSLHNLMATMGSAYSVKGLDVVRHLGPKLDFLPSGMQNALLDVFGLANNSGILSIDDHVMTKPQGLTFNDIINSKIVADSKLVSFWEKLYNKQPSGFIFIAKPEIGGRGDWADQGVLPGGIFSNPFFRLKSPYSTSRLFNEGNLELKDAGIDFNLPFPPLLRPERGVNVIIAFDASSSADRGPKALKFAYDYAKQKGLKFPVIDDKIFEEAKNHNLTVIGDPSDADALTIIYIPLLQNKSLPAPYGSYSPLNEKYTSTFNFAYPLDGSRMLIEAVRQNVRSFESTIKDVLQKKAHALN